MKDAGKWRSSKAEPPLVGRVKEFTTIRRALTLASGSKGSMILIEGEAGIGKTRLIRECRKEAEKEGFTVLWGNCFDYRKEPYLPFREMLKEHFGISPLDDFQNNKERVKEKMKGTVLRDPNFLEEFSSLFISKDEPAGGFTYSKDDVENLVGHLRRKGFRVLLITDSDDIHKRETDPKVDTLIIGEGEKGAVPPTRLERIAHIIQGTYSRFQHCAVVNDAVRSLSRNNPEGKFENLVGIVNDIAVENNGIVIHVTGETYPDCLNDLDDISSSIRIEGDREKEESMGMVKGKLSTNELFFTYFKEVSRGDPLLLVVEDLQWSDKHSMNLLQYIARDIHQESMCILGSYRSEEYGLDDPEMDRGPLRETLQRMSREHLFETITLNRLEENEQWELVSNIVGFEPEEQMMKELMDQTEGNPRFLIDRLKGDGTHGVASEIMEDVAPQLEESTIRKRLDRLDRKARSILEFSSLIGMEVTMDMIIEGLDLEEGEFLDSMDEISELKLMSEKENGFRFEHQRVRSSIISSMDEKRKKEMHLLAASTLEKLTGARESPALFNIAKNYMMGGDMDRAYKGFMESAEGDMERMEEEKALTPLSLALECLDRLPRNRERNIAKVETLQMMGDIKESMGDTRGAIKAFKEAMDVAEKGSIPFATSSSYRRIGDVMLKLFDWDQTVDYYLRSLHLSKQENDQEEVARSFRGLGHIYYLRGDYTRAMECYLKYMEFPKKERRSVTVMALIEMGDIYFEMGDLNQALTYYILGVKKGEEKDLKLESALAYSSMAVVLLKLGELEESRRYAKWAFNMVGDHLGSEIAKKVLINHVEIMLDLADTENAREGFENLLSIPEESFENLLLKGLRFRAIGLYLSRQRDFEGGVENMKRAEEILKKLQLPFHLGMTYYHLGLVMFQQMKVEEAVEFFEMAFSTFKSINAIFFLNRASSKLRELKFVLEGLRE